MILDLLGEPPGRVLELGFAGIHAAPLQFAGWEVVVVEPDPAFRARAAVKGSFKSSSTTRAPICRANGTDPSVDPEST